MKNHSIYGILLGATLIGQATSTRAQQTTTTPAVNRSAPGPYELTARTPIALDLLPGAVQATLHKNAVGWPVLAVEQGTINGQTVYEAILDRKGQKLPLQIASNGGLIQSAVNDRFFATVGVLPAHGAGVPSDGPVPLVVPDWRTAPARVPLSEATAVSFQSVPEPARRTLIRYSGGAQFGTVQQGKLGDRTVYAAEVHPGGQKFVLRVDGNGTFVNDQVNDQFLAQRAAAASPTNVLGVGRGPLSESVTASASGPDLAPLLNGTSVPISSIPAPVQATVQAQGNSTAIGPISRGTLDGRTVYDATIQRGDQPVRLRIAEDGSVVGSQPAPQ